MTENNNNTIKLSDLFIKDFEEVRKKCMEMWCSCIEKHYQLKPDIYKTKKYEDLAYNYKPFEGLTIMDKYSKKCKCRCFTHNIEIIKEEWSQEGYCFQCKNFCLEEITCNYCKEKYIEYQNSTIEKSIEDVKNKRLITRDPYKAYAEGA